MDLKHAFMRCVLLCWFEEIQLEEMATSGAGHVGSSHSRLASMMLHMDAWDDGMDPAADAHPDRQAGGDKQTANNVP